MLVTLGKRSDQRNADDDSEISVWFRVHDKYSVFHPEESIPLDLTASLNADSRKHCLEYRKYLPILGNEACESGRARELYYIHLERLSERGILAQPRGLTRMDADLIRIGCSLRLEARQERFVWTMTNWVARHRLDTSLIEGWCVLVRWSYSTRSRCIV